MVKKKNQSGFCAYLGPTIRGVVQNGTIYEGGLDEVLALLAPAIERYPLIAKLISAGDDLPANRERIKTKGTYLYDVNRRFIAILQKGGVKDAD